MYSRDFDHIIIEIRMILSGSHHSENRSISGFDFFDIGSCLVAQCSLEIEYDARHIRMHEC
jgi:hypothetical protein